MIAGMTAQTLPDAATDLEVLGITLPQVPESIPLLHFAEAQRMMTLMRAARLSGLLAKDTR